MRVQETILCGHWHRTSEHTETTGISRKVSSCWSVGCLCDLSPDYAIVNRWNHGFAIVDIDKDGKIEAEEMFSWPLMAKLNAHIAAAAAAEKVPLTWGGLWKSFPDAPHYELPRNKYPA